MADDNAALFEMIGLWAVELQWTLERGVAVVDTCRPGRLIWTGNLAFFSAFTGHAWATARFQFVLFPNAGMPVHAELIAKYGTIQRLVAPLKGLRTRQQLLNAMEDYKTCNIEYLTLPLAP